MMGDEIFMVLGVLYVFNVYVNVFMSDVIIDGFVNFYIYSSRRYVLYDVCFVLVL